MSVGFILGALTVLSLIIGSASTLWGMFTKTTFDDEGGNKRLTPAGHVAVALALGSFVTAIALFGLKTVSDQQAVDAKAQKDTLAEEATKAKNFRDELRDLQAEEDRRIAAADRRTALAETRATSAEQRLLIATTAREQRERDQELARDVNRGSSQNLERTRQALVKSDAALVQLQRLLSPIRDIEIEITWCIPGTTPGLAAAVKPLTDYAKTLPGIHDVGIAGGFRPDIRLDIDTKSPFHPASGKSTVNLPLNSTGFISFYNAADRKAGFHRSEQDLISSADITFPFGSATNSNISLITKDSRGDVFFETVVKPDASQIGMTGKMLSIEDMAGSTIALFRYTGRVRTLEEDYTLFDSVVPVEFRVTISNRTFYILDQEIKRLPSVYSASNAFAAEVKMNQQSELHRWSCSPK